LSKIFLKSQHWSQIGRIFVYLVALYFGQFLKITNSVQILERIFTTITIWRFLLIPRINYEKNYHNIVFEKTAIFSQKIVIMSHDIDP
jgi:hypothetical protein